MIDLNKRAAFTWGTIIGATLSILILALMGMIIWDQFNPLRSNIEECRGTCRPVGDGCNPGEVYQTRDGCLEPGAEQMNQDQVCCLGPDAIREDDESDDGDDEPPEDNPDENPEQGEDDEQTGNPTIEIRKGDDWVNEIPNGVQQTISEGEQEYHIWAEGVSKGSCYAQILNETDDRVWEWERSEACIGISNPENSPELNFTPQASWGSSIDFQVILYDDENNWLSSVSIPMTIQRTEEGE